MSEVHEQVQLDAPVSEVWALVGDPRRYPEWLPRALEVHGERFEEQAEFIQVSSRPVGEVHFLIDRKEELREIRMHCTVSGMFVNWQLTGARGGTFVSAAFGMDPIRRQDRVFDAIAGRRFFRRWLNQALDSLKGAVEPGSSA